MKNLWNKNNNNPCSSLQFNNLINSLMNPCYQNGQKNEPMKLILFLYERLKELNEPLNNFNNNINMYQNNNTNIPNELIQFRQENYSNNNSVIYNNFYFEQILTTKCSFCNFNFNNYNIMNCLIFHLSEVFNFLQRTKEQGFSNINLYDCFDQSLENNIQEGILNQSFCNNCYQKSNLYMSQKLNTCPKILTIILKCANDNEYEYQFNFPINLDIKKYVEDKLNGTKYELICILSHSGNKNNFEYVAYCKSPVDFKWYYYKDEQVNKISGWDQVHNEMNSNGVPYALFYQKK